MVDECDRMKHSKKRFHVLTKAAQCNLHIFEYIVICLMILVAITSIIWSLSLHVLFDDFYNGFADITLAFSERDFSHLKNYEEVILENDLNRINQIYQNHADGLLLGDDIKTEARTMPRALNLNKDISKKITIKKLHLNSEEIWEGNDTNHLINHPQYGNVSINQLHLIQDYYFLTHMTINIQRTRWRHSVASYFIYNFSYLSEIIAIIWAVLSIVFQSGVKKQWGLPQPWLIVIPSMIMFSLMVMANLSYMILANGYLNKVCQDIKSNLKKPEIIRCGDVISLLRPIIRSHDFTLDTYFILYRWSYTFTLVLWICALIFLIVRFLLAIDFRLVEINGAISSDAMERIDKAKQDCLEVLINAPTDSKSFKEQNKLDDDFQSAKSHVSEAATPLLENLLTTTSVKI